MILIILGLIMIALGVLLLLLRRRTQARLRAITATPTSAIGEVLRLHQESAGARGAGSVGQLVEVTGMIQCDAPLTAELSGEPCVYYHMSVEERYEEQYEERDAQGRPQLRTRTDSTTVASTTQSTRFWVEDESGRIRVEPGDAEIQPQEALNRYEPFQDGAMMLRVGAFSVALGTPAAGRTVLGHTYRESLLPLHRRVYIIGEAGDNDGALCIRKPGEQGQPFIVSLKSEEEIVSSGESSMGWYLGGVIASFVLGVVVVVAGIVL
jgi:E3 Ubiquitin ligase